MQIAIIKDERPDQYDAAIRRSQKEKTWRIGGMIYAIEKLEKIGNTVRLTLNSGVGR